MIELSNKINVITEESKGKFKVSLIDSKTLKELFTHEFIVYSNFDKKGLIDDAIFMFKNKVKNS